MLKRTTNIEICISCPLLVLTEQYHSLAPVAVFQDVQQAPSGDLLFERLVRGVFASPALYLVSHESLL